MVFRQCCSKYSFPNFAKVKSCGEEDSNMIVSGKRRNDFYRVSAKVVNKQSLSDKNLAHTKMELLLLKFLQVRCHPNIVRLLDEYEDRHYVILVFPTYEYDLLDFLEHHIVSEKCGAFIIKQLVAAVKHLHSYNILHRDIKLENILINPKGPKVVLTDFGLAEFCYNESLKESCGSLGKPLVGLQVLSKLQVMQLPKF